MDLDIMMKRLKSNYVAGRHKADPFKVLIATIMSHRTNDDVTYPAADRLFDAYPDAKRLARAPVERIADIIYPVGFYNMKAQRIKKVAGIIDEEYGGRVPDTLEELLKLPSVGRKTANCVLVFAFNRPAIPVDTHVHRISNRMGLVETEKPEDTEKALMRLLPKKYWIDFNEILVAHGRRLCRPIGPKCDACFLDDICLRIV